MDARIYDEAAPKKAANLSINSDLLRQARELDINLSRALEERLEALVLEARRKRWEEEDRQFLDWYTRFVEETGVFGEEWRTF